jgi:hypothetical protein
LCTTGGVTATAVAHASVTHYQLNIPRQSLDTALKDLARQTGLQIGRFSDAVKGDTMVGPITGSYSSDEALRTLLTPTTFTYRALNDRAIIVLRPEDAAQLPAAQSLTGDSPPADDGDTKGAGDDKKSVWSGLRLAQGAATGAARQATGERRVTLDEIIVTAQKRSERLQDVPVPVTVLVADKLVAQGKNRMQDYFATVPGLNFNPGQDGGTKNLAVRGVITTTASNPTVGVVIDDAPVGASSYLGSGSLLAPEVSPSELASVEVLRGPQGTLYGAPAALAD